MIKQNENNLALSLRKQGLSYSEILKQVPVAKSTLSLWLRKVGLSKKQNQRLTEKKLAAMKRGWAKVHQNRLDRRKVIIDNAALEIGKIGKRERWLLGVFLYWAEGAKEREYTMSTCPKFSNSDPDMIKFFKEWLLEFLSVEENILTYELYIHEKADWEKSAQYWSEILKVDRKLIRVYFKRHNPIPKRKNIGRTYNGQLRITVNGSVDLTRKIEGWTLGICKNCGVV